MLCKCPWVLTVTKQAWGVFACTLPLHFHQAHKASWPALAARSWAPAMQKHQLSLAARPRLVTGQRRSEGHFSVNISNYFFFRQAENEGRDESKFWRNLRAFSLPFLAHAQTRPGLSVQTAGKWGAAPNERSKESRLQVSKASALS